MPPLKGIKVIDLSLLLPGPLCSMYLGDMGAEVIKVENPRAFDGTRVMFKAENGMPALYYMVNRNKKAITLNLKKEKGIEILFRLLKDADILLEGFRPDALDGMGIGYDVLKEKFPRLIYCGIYGYGASGPYKTFAGHDGNYLSMAGIIDQIGGKDSAPNMAGFQLADIGGGTLNALSAILAALYSREKTGKGQKIDISMMEGSLQFLSLYTGIYTANKKNPERGNELLSGKLPNYNIYKVKDNRYVFLGALEEMFFQIFLKQIGKDGILKEKPLEESNLDYYKILLIDYFKDKSYEDLKPLFENPNCCLTPIQKLDEVFKDPHLKERKMIFEMEHPRYGKFAQIAAPFNFSDTKCEYNLLPPEHGQHNQEILSSLGLSESELNELAKERVI